MKTDKCIYCLQKSNSTDHAISRGLFPEGYLKKNIITVPSCQACNQGFSFDEEYFRNFLCSLSLERSKDAEALIFSKIKRSIKRRPAIGKKMLEKMELVNLVSEEGIYLGEKTKLSISEDDWVRYFNVLGKYIKALFFKELKTTIPEDYTIKHFMGNKKIVDQLGMLNKWDLNNKEIFAYGFNYIPNTLNSVWGTIFYDSVFFMSYVLDPAQYGLFLKSIGKKDDAGE